MRFPFWETRCGGLTQETSIGARRLKGTQHRRSKRKPKRVRMQVAEFLAEERKITQTGETARPQYCRI